MSDSLHSYPKVYNLGHPAIAELLDGPVAVEEKVDGSQFSFGVDAETGDLLCRSKGQHIITDAPEKMFARAVETAQSLRGVARAGWTYRCEYLQSPRHNALAYDRVPRNYLILFDVEIAPNDFLTPDDMRREAERIGLEAVPVIRVGAIESYDVFHAMLDTVSLLGGQKIEGVVIKNYARFGKDGKVLMGKHVSADFREVHKGQWRKDNPTRGDIVNEIIATYRTPARWRKSAQHLREAGTLTDSPKDIGALMKATGEDVMEECADEIKAALWKFAWPKIQRGVTAGLPQWYKDELAKQQFAECTRSESDREPAG